MRFFLIGLLILNIVFFIWQQSRDSTPAAPFIAVSNGVEGLVMVREQAAVLAQAMQKADQKKTRQSATQVKDFAAAPRKPEIKADKNPKIVRKKKAYCYQLGQFKAREEVDVALTGMNALDYQAELKMDYPLKSKLLVYLQAYPSLQEARKVTEDLKSRGITDYQILAVYGKKNGISLGVFSSREVALDRVREIRNIGYEPVLQPVSGKLWYKIRFSRRDKAELSGQETRFLLKSFKNIKIRPIKCG